MTNYTRIYAWLVLFYGAQSAVLVVHRSFVNSSNIIQYPILMIFSILKNRISRSDHFFFLICGCHAQSDGNVLASKNLKPGNRKFSPFELEIRDQLGRKY